MSMTMSMRVLLNVAVATAAFVYSAMVYDTGWRRGAVANNPASGSPPRGEPARFGADSVPPVPLTELESVGRDVTFFLPPMEVELRVATPEQWRDELAGSDVVGLTHWTRRPGEPCRVVVPAELMIVVADPDIGKAKWQDPYTGDTLAHELLHCARGAWHPAWNEIIARKIRK